MIMTFVSTIDSISEDNVVRFVDKAGGYTIPDAPQDIETCIQDAFTRGARVEISYDDRSLHIEDARPVTA